MSRQFTRDFLIEVAKGNIAGHSLVHKFGSADITTAIVPITSALVYQTPTVAASLEFVSSAAGDALNGVGAREITFIGLDASWNEQTVVMATHATDGTTAVAISGTWFRLYRWYVSQSGTYATAVTGSHVGTLTTRVSGAGATWDTIGIAPLALGQSEIGVYTIPTGKTGYLMSKLITVDGIKEANVFFFQRPFADDVTTPFTGTMRLVEHEVGIQQNLNVPTESPKGPFVGPCDIGFLGETTAGTAEVSVEFELLIVDN